MTQQFQNMKLKKGRKPKQFIKKNGELCLVCSKCKQELSVNNFSKLKNASTGYHSICKNCQKIYWKKYINHDILSISKDKRSVKYFHRNGVHGIHSNQRKQIALKDITQEIGDFYNKNYIAHEAKVLESLQLDFQYISI